MVTCAVEMSEKEAAGYLGISPYYLRNMRHGIHTHEGPPFTFKRGYHNGVQTVYYQHELDTWKASHKFRTWRKPCKKP